MCLRIHHPSAVVEGACKSVEREPGNGGGKVGCTGGKVGCTGGKVGCTGGKVGCTEGKVGCTGGSTEEKRQGARCRLCDALARLGLAQELRCAANLAGSRCWMQGETGMQGQRQDGVEALAGAAAAGTHLRSPRPVVQHAVQDAVVATGVEALVQLVLPASDIAQGQG
jgi:hypothetical protein